MSEPHSDAFVFFGATGDLAKKQVFPALQAMIKHGHLDVPIIGLARSDWSHERLLGRARESIAAHGAVDEAAFAILSKLLRYVNGDYNDPQTFQRIREALGGAQHPLHYLAIPPDLFEPVVKELGASGCAKGARVIVEKPFGRDLKSAQELNSVLHTAFPEEAIFRIDHYLGKEAVQNLHVFRFANTFLEPIWNRNYIDSVQLTMAETFGVEGRGGFYEETGVIRDVVQNHILQVIAALAMEPPGSNDKEAARDEVAKLLRQIKPIAKDSYVAGQFSDYKKENGVAKDSQVPTFAALKLSIDSFRWDGVPFLVRAGKELPVTVTELRVQLKRPPLLGMGPADGNYLRLRLSPEVTIAIGAQVKKPGQEMVAEPTELSFLHHPGGDEMSPYERLLGDAMSGDATLFAREDAVEAAWTIVDPALQDSPIHTYEKGTWGPQEAEALAAPFGGWAVPGGKP